MFAPKWHPDMTAEEVRKLLEYCNWLDQCYADAAAADQENYDELADELEESFDPVRDGWVDHMGRP